VDDNASRQTTGSKAGRFFSGVLKFFGVLILILLVLEVALRIFGNYGHTTSYVPDERLLWVPVPGPGLDVATHVPVTISPDRFRYPVALGPKQPGQIRIFAFGDSVTQGWGVRDNATYSADLERLLNAYHCPGVQFEGISAGVDAYSNAQVNDRLQAVFQDGFQPDIAIVAYSFNTEFENFTDLKGANRQALLRRVWLKHYVRQSAVYEYVVEHLLRRFIYYKLRTKLVAGSWNVGTRKVADTARFYRELQQSLATCRQHHATMILLLLPSNQQRGNLDPMQQTMLDFARNENVPIVNIIDSWKDKDQVPLFGDHVHPTAAGHELIAEQLAGLIKRLGKIPCVPGEAAPATPAIVVATSNAASKPLTAVP
jgi:lysophospholipase L1-like esterase